ncbi:hypothetical protein BH23BAC1_BH23BAC1_33680 [soil metagenome]
MPKSKILLASILKPVDDTRMYEKLALSLSQTNKYEINIIGFCSKNKNYSKNINFFPLYCYSRSSFKRIYSSLKFLKITIKLKPELLIITTPELLLAACFYKFFFKANIIYDIQENYKNNIIYTPTYPVIIKYMLAYMVRAIEKFCSRFICHFFLAEKCYGNELPFIHQKFTILENKYKSILSRELKDKKPDGAGITFLFSGTLSENYGIFQAIDFVKKIQPFQKDTKLLIMGRCAIPSTLEKIKEKISGFGFIELIGGDYLVPHMEIVKAIQKADFGIVSYQPDRSTESKIPTKFFEYMALQLPIILQNHQPWVDFCAPFLSALPIDFKDFDIVELNNKLNNSNFYSSGISKDLFWESEENKLLKVVEKCLK